MEFLSFGILIVQFCNKIHGLLGFKFSKLTYRKIGWQLSTCSFWLVVLTQFCRFLFDKIHSFAERNLTCRWIFSFLALFAIEEGTIFEDKFFMLFIFFIEKKKTAKIFLHKLASVCYCFFRLKWANIIIKLIDIFFQFQEYTANGNTR